MFGRGGSEHFFLFDALREGVSWRSSSLSPIRKTFERVWLGGSVIAPCVFAFVCFSYPVIPPAAGRVGNVHSLHIHLIGIQSDFSQVFSTDCRAVTCSSYHHLQSST